MTFLQKVNLESSNINFNGIYNGIYNVTGKNIYVFSDGNQESEKCFITIMITNINNNNYKIELFNNKFLIDCNKPDIILYGKIIENKIEIINDKDSNKSHKFYFDNKILNYEFNVNHNSYNYLELGIFEGAKLDI
jgi:hypothetical protein